MNIFSVFTLCGGLAFFLFGMHIMSQNLEKLAGGKLETALQKITSNPFKSLGLGIGITIAVQSSSAVTVMLVGLVNSGIMNIEQTVGVIMGSNIGTTLTAWILSAAGIESDNVFISLLKPENFAPLVALLGVALFMISKKKKRQNMGMILVGFAVLMYGMELMKNAVAPLAETESFQRLLVAFHNPIVGVLFGALFTGIIQSSAASVGILQALSLTGSISYQIAIPVIMGQNIGTCATALLSSIGVNKNAKRVTAVHILFNVIGTVFCLTVFYGLDAIVHFTFVNRAINPVEIAFVHSVFNVVTTVILLPFSNRLVKISYRLIPDKTGTVGKDNVEWLDERLLYSPPLATAQCRSKANSMAHISKTCMQDAVGIMFQYDTRMDEKVEEGEQMLDVLEDNLGTYMLKLSQESLTEKDSRIISELLHTIGDYERIGDHAVNMVKISRLMNEESLAFSDEAKADLITLFAAITEISEITVKAHTTHDLSLAVKVEPLEEVIDRLIAKAKHKHIVRLQKKTCTPELGVYFSDLLIFIERISDHYSNIAAMIIQIANNNVLVHDYLNDLHEENSPQYKKTFKTNYNYYERKYRLASD
ncbi:MAG: Na/Pi cotransporter family protein [Ruminococcaceae bacterium]|nr:Na/Pi cotransporter family protein [Oscillospiraceae bacterium]